MISDEMLRAAQLDEAEFRIELAIGLYQQQRLSLGQAIEWSGVDCLEFQRCLRERDISIHYDFAKAFNQVYGNRILRLSPSKVKSSLLYVFPPP